MNSKIAIDSNSLTFLVDAMMGRYDPSMDSGEIALQKISLLRIFIYRGVLFYVLPTVEREYKKIKNKMKLQEHKDICGVLLFDNINDPDANSINCLVKKYLEKHKGKNDCKILAEATLCNVDTLLTYDNTFYKRLRNHSGPVSLQIPSKYWNALNLTKGISPIWSPHKTNPLFKETWWVWK